MKNEVQKQKKKYTRKGKRKEVLFKDDELEVLKQNLERMGVDTLDHCRGLLFCPEKVLVRFRRSES